ncbi:MAG: threonylcarbamoyl-AMP synthase [Gammaproteobacteria bacterium]|nr:threonylcarbamoyl-AMP synthase [Gammaproteobacteria bacterium]NIR81654.1 threonylcarbamoyl-AMP synthase [Gammaproteobacteria bacterium]NIR88205.1 threonylcarbamoyl-AMP synthase [Gammaproteobacteria bacterium]NIU02766.1 threonylcarbamoyl-AMP synthase [Gammaproteobacteria bacterium]NIV73365.1 threonylcarbamoyl-AMP synthase [Gammaproteobacteria bacterium]
MSQFFQIHPENPQPRLIKRAVEILRAGGLIVYPTDSCYALGCHLGDTHAVERIRQIRRVDDGHHFTLVCRDLSELATYARVDNTAYRLLRSFTPGPYTFILRATREVPRRLQHPRRRTIGLRVPDNAIAQALLDALGEPLISSTLLLPEEEMPMTDPKEIRERLEGRVDLVIDGGNCGLEPTSVVDLSEEMPRVVRRGRGEVAAFEA